MPRPPPIFVVKPFRGPANEVGVAVEGQGYKLPGLTRCDTPFAFARSLLKALENLRVQLILAAVKAGFSSHETA